MAFGETYCCHSPLALTPLLLGVNKLLFKNGNKNAALFAESGAKFVEGVVPDPNIELVGVTRFILDVIGVVVVFTIIVLLAFRVGLGSVVTFMGLGLLAVVVGTGAIIVVSFPLLLLLVLAVSLFVTFMTAVLGAALRLLFAGFVPVSNVNFFLLNLFDAGAGVALFVVNADLGSAFVVLVFTTSMCCLVEIGFKNVGVRLVFKAALFEIGVVPLLL